MFCDAYLHYVWRIGQVNIVRQRDSRNSSADSVTKPELHARSEHSIGLSEADNNGWPAQLAGVDGPSQPLRHVLPGAILPRKRGTRPLGLPQALAHRAAGGSPRTPDRAHVMRSAS